VLTKEVSLAILNGRLSPLAYEIASAGRLHAKDVMMGMLPYLRTFYNFRQNQYFPILLWISQRQLRRGGNTKYGAGFHNKKCSLAKALKSEFTNGLDGSLQESESWQHW